MIYWCLTHPWIALVATAIVGMLIQWYERRQYKRR